MDIRIQLQGISKNGWDIEDVQSMDDVHAFFYTPHVGRINVWHDGCIIAVMPNIGAKLSHEEYIQADCMIDDEW